MLEQARTQLGYFANLAGAAEHKVLSRGGAGSVVLEICTDPLRGDIPDSEVTLAWNDEHSRHAVLALLKLASHIRDLRTT